VDADDAALAEVLIRQTGSRLHSLKLGFVGGAGSRAAAVASGIMWLLWQSPLLRYLHLAPRGLSVLPPLTQLHVLMLQLQDAEGVQMLPVLPLFTGLQRLRLVYDVLGQAEVLLRTAPIDLSALQHLSWVSLTSISPESIRLNAACSLRVELDITEEGLAGNGWPHVPPTVSMKYLSWEHESVVLARLPHFAVASSLTNVKLHVNSIGTERCPLVVPAALQRLQRLHLVALCIYLEIPEGVQWTEADIKADDRLLLTFRDCSAFVEHSQALSLQYDSFTGSGIIDLCRTLSESGRKYYSHCKEVGTWMMTLGKYEVSVVSKLMMETPMWAADCACRVCVKCLNKARHAL
jgi:hypothetical protein